MKLVNLGLSISLREARTLRAWHTDRKTELGMAFGAVLAEARGQRGLTQEALAARIDYSRVQIAYLETGVREPSLEALLRLERALELPSGDLTRRTAQKLG